MEDKEQSLYDCSKNFVDIKKKLFVWYITFLTRLIK